MKIAYLGVGCWGYCLASLLAEKGHDVTAWTILPDLAETINETREHPRLPGHKTHGNLHITTDLDEALEGAEMIVESVTAAGIRPVFQQLKEHGIPDVPIVLTSKGIEQHTGLILSDVITEIFGVSIKERIGAVSGPSYASEVIHGLPTSVTGSAYNKDLMELVCSTFTTDTFRVYPNKDMRGVAYGGALKNVIAIACGLAEGLGLGYSARAALMTRGLHEINKLAIAQGARSKTLYGLSGMGDLCVTCSCMTSRNFHFGYLLSQGLTYEEASEKIGMVIEGAYTAVSALELCRAHRIPMPITETIYEVLYENLALSDVVPLLMKRTIKAEHL